MSFNPPKTDHEEVDLFIEGNLKILSETFERSTNYTNLLLVAGYAGFFALWQITRDLLSRRQVVVSALLMLLSITIFIVYEIYRSLYASIYLHGYYKTISNSEVRESIAAMNQAICDFQAHRRKGVLASTIIWAIVFSLTTLTGIAAALILLYSLIRAL